ncbi:MAG: hypothetical protein JW791_00675 [Nanoarchaeota archaeon]|nr:hypothetical protein [Nanoarchaeota archaeon]
MKLFNELKKIPGVLESAGKLYTTDKIQNFNIARIIYSRFNGELIATALDENPNYSQDLALNFKGRSLKRLARQEFCSKKDEEEIISRFSNAEVKLELIVLPEGTIVENPTGMFCKEGVNYLAFTAKNDPFNNSNRIGEVLTGERAEALFNYFNNLCKEHSNL